MRNFLKILQKYEKILLNFADLRNQQKKKFFKVYSIWRKLDKN